MAGRPAAPVQILPPNAVLVPAAVAQEKLGPFQLRLMLDDDVHPQIAWLAARGLLKNSFDCPRCAIPCSFVAQHDTQDGWRWKCRRCHQRHGVREGSFFKSKVPLGKLVWFLFSWATEIPLQPTPCYLATDAIAKNCRGLGELCEGHLCARCATKPATAGRFRQQWPAHCC